jgi:hypothetical protein
LLTFSKMLTILLQVTYMKTLFVLLTAIFLLTASQAFAVDKVAKNSDSSKAAVAKQDQGKEQKHYQNFIDIDNNGIDDELEKSVKNSTNIKPKPEQATTKPQSKETSDKIEPQPEKQKIDKVEKKPVSTDKSEKKESEKK